VPSATPEETQVEPESEELPEPLASCIREDGSAPAVHAAFYLWYGNPETDGRWIHWDHKVLPHWDPKVDAQHEKFDWRPPDEPHSTFFPARGTYSSADNATLRAQFRELRQAGVDSAMCSWWGQKDWNGKRDDAESGANTDLLMPLVLEAAAAAEVFVSFHIEPYGNRSAKTFLEDLKYIFREYGDHPAIYREGKDKRPIFWLYDVSAQHSASEVAEWRAVLDSVLVPPWMVCFCVYGSAMVVAGRICASYKRAALMERTPISLLKASHQAPTRRVGRMSQGD